MVVMNRHYISRRREYREGWAGRRRTYTCRGCGKRFREDRLESLPVKARLCGVRNDETPGGYPNYRAYRFCGNQEVELMRDESGQLVAIPVSKAIEDKPNLVYLLRNVKLEGE